MSATARSTSKSAVSRKFVAMTEAALAELLAADLTGLDLVALMIDGVHFGESCCVVGAGHRLRNYQAPAGAGRGRDRECHRVTGLLVGLRDGGLDVTRPILVGMDGAKALARP